MGDKNRGVWLLITFISNLKNKKTKEKLRMMIFKLSQQQRMGKNLHI